MEMQKTFPVGAKVLRFTAGATSGYDSCCIAYPGSDGVMVTEEIEVPGIITGFSSGLVVSVHHVEITVHYETVIPDEP